MRVETLFTGFENRTAAGRQLAKARVDRAEAAKP